MSDPIVIPPVSTPQVTLWREAFDLVRDEILAVSRDDLDPILFDIPTAIATVHGIQEKLAALRPLIAQLPFYDMRRHDNLLHYALAMGKAHSEHAIAVANAQSLPGLHERAVALRQTLVTDVTALVQRGYIQGDRIKGLKGAVGYKNAAYDLQLLASLLRENMPLCTSKSAITEQDVYQAELLCAQNIEAVGERDHESRVAETALVRAQAYTLFNRTYEHARRVVAYIRHDQQDADLIIPSLHIRTPQARKREEDEVSGEVEVEPVTPAPVLPAAVGGEMPAAPGLPVTDPFGRR